MTDKMRASSTNFMFLVFLVVGCSNSPEVLTVHKEQVIAIGSLDEWQGKTADNASTVLMKNLDIGGEFDLFGDGALLLEKIQEGSFVHSDSFVNRGDWTSTWLPGTQDGVVKVQLQSIIYGNPIDMSQGWVKFSGNPVLSGSNTLLPLDSANITSETLLLPEPAGVPQDQTILRGSGKWQDKWLLFFNHTPHKWPYDYYWSVVVADSLASLKAGVNPFYVPSDIYPLHGPIDKHAPNDWIDIDGVYYAPDENYDGDSHMWVSQNLVDWENIGEIEGINGSDPGIVYDGESFYLFNEAHNAINFNRLDSSMTQVIEGDQVLEVGGHTGDADVSFFNNQWHMFFDDGPHLHYDIGYAVTRPSQFPHGWQMSHKIYGPYNPDQGQRWDDDTDEGNRFGTGDADIAIEGNTLYLFTERPIGAAYRELKEIFDASDQSMRISLQWDENRDGIVDGETDWIEFVAGDTSVDFQALPQNAHFQIKLGLSTDNPIESPVVQHVTVYR